MSKFNKRVWIYTLFKTILPAFFFFFGFTAFLNKTLHDFQVAYLHTILICKLLLLFFFLPNALII